ncbi:dnaJ homolog subfamily B member 1-like isoform X2 [Coccinella septempunctata]|uniref:dnaJ homolog subfamily B member 1-like isoform X2 n=1 Tax=Coccinella septempunctata TaxID=41139 RepID=UPI001D05D677|nr:dnaJ homolog subfamily B member 1-like isoform X2 [Coccinella septempunctata]
MAITCLNISDLLISIEDLPQYEAKPSAQLRKQNSSRPGSRPQTAEELDRIIHQILNTDNYYDMLKIENSATEKDIKKSFKKLALLLHPDKTKHPGAGEAFKAIRNALSILTDPTKRRQYDIYGPEAVFAPSSSCSFRSTFSGKQDGNSSENASEHNSSEGDNGGLYDKTTKYETFTLKLIWPIIFAIILTCVTTSFMHDPSYSLQKSVKYPMLRYTHNLRIPYYVKENFLMENSGLAITQLDNEVEIETITNLQYACYNERSYRKCFSLVWYNLRRV